MLWLLLACAPETAPPAASAVPSPAAATGAQAPDPDLGARVFQERCAACHGAGGKGDGPAAAALTPPPKDLSRPRSPEERRPPSRVEIVRAGSPGTAMPGWQGVLPADELAAVEGHMHALAHGPTGDDRVASDPATRR